MIASSMTVRTKLRRKLFPIPIFDAPLLTQLLLDNQIKPSWATQIWSHILHYPGFNEIINNDRNNSSDSNNEKFPLSDADIWNYLEHGEQWEEAEKEEFEEIFNDSETEDDENISLSQSQPSDSMVEFLALLDAEEMRENGQPVLAKFIPTSHVPLLNHLPLTVLDPQSELLYDSVIDALISS